MFAKADLVVTTIEYKYTIYSWKGIELEDYVISETYCCTSLDGYVAAPNSQLPVYLSLSGTNVIASGSTITYWEIYSFGGSSYSFYDTTSGKYLTCNSDGTTSLQSTLNSANTFTFAVDSDGYTVLQPSSDNSKYVTFSGSSITCSSAGSNQQWFVFCGDGGIVYAGYGSTTCWNYFPTSSESEASIYIEYGVYNLYVFVWEFEYDGEDIGNLLLAEDTEGSYNFYMNYLAGDTLVAIYSNAG